MGDAVGGCHEAGHLSRDPSHAKLENPHPAGRETVQYYRV
jgi:hypothetical protein